MAFSRVVSGVVCVFCGVGSHGFVSSGESRMVMFQFLKCILVIVQPVPGFRMSVLSFCCVSGSSFWFSMIW